MYFFANPIALRGSVQLAKKIHPSLFQCCFSSTFNYETLQVDSPSKHVYSVNMNRPKKHNAMSKVMWTEIGDVFSRLAVDPDCRSIVLAGNGKNFSSGIDLADFMTIGQIVMGDEDAARKAVQVERFIAQFQECFTQLEKCSKPVVAAVWGVCVGGAVDLLCATDVRYCSSDAYFQVKEADLGLAADIGTLQRLPKVLGSQSLVNELCLTCRRMHAAEALQHGLVSRTFPDKEATLAAAIALAEEIASKSPVAVQGTKRTLVHSRDHTVQEGLDFIRHLNMTFLQSEDVRKAAMAMMQKEKAEFENL